MTENVGAAIELSVFIRLRDGAVTDDIDLTDSYPAQDMTHSAGQLVGAISLAVGITALTLLTAITLAFRGVIVGSLLGDAVAVQVRGVDYIAVVATVALGVLAIADVIFLNVIDRAAEFAVICTFGWRETMLSRLVITEGTIIGLTGSLAGAALALTAAAEFTGQLSTRLFLIAAAAVAGGVLVTAAAALLPARALRRLPVPSLLAEE